MSEPSIVVLGAGSIGCFLGGAWQAAGGKVTLVGRERVRAEIAEHGLAVSDLTGWKRALQPDEISFATKPAALAKADVIALCVKSNGTEAAAREIARHGRKGATVISFQNGVSNAETLRRLLPKFAVAQAVVAFNVAHLGAGRWHKGTSGELVVQETEVTKALAAALGDGPARLNLAKDVAALAWGKLLINLNNAVNALSGETLLAQLSQRDYRRVVAAAIIETLGVLDTAGIEPAQVGPIPPKLLPHAIGAPDFIFKNLMLRVQKIDANARSSMADDLAAGRPTEVDYLNGEVVRLGRSLGRATPVNSAIVELVKQAEIGVQHIWSANQFYRHVLEGHGRVAILGY